MSAYYVSDTTHSTLHLFSFNFHQSSVVGTGLTTIAEMQPIIHNTIHFFIFFYFLISEGEQGFHNCFFSETMVKFKCQRAVLCQQTVWGNQRTQESFSVDGEVRFLGISETRLSFLTKESQPETGYLSACKDLRSQGCGQNQRLLLEELRLGPHETNSTGQTQPEE